MTRIPPTPSIPPHPNPSERVWSLQRSGRLIDCELHINRREEWECRLVDEDWLIYRRTFTCRADALAHAQEQQEKLMQHGWTYG